MKLLTAWIHKIKTVPLYIGGMVPADPNVPDSGTAVGLFPIDGPDEIALGPCDENGEFHGRIPRRFIGKKIRFPVRHAGFVYDHEFVIRVQPWGVSHAVRMRFDQVYNGKKTAAAKAFEPIADQEYLKAIAKSQYVTRNQVNRTIWFWMAVAIALLTTLVTAGLPEWIGYAATICFLIVRAYLTKLALGLSKKPI